MLPLQQIASHNVQLNFEWLQEHASKEFAYSDLLAKMFQAYILSDYALEADPAENSQAMMLYQHLRHLIDEIQDM